MNKESKETEKLFKLLTLSGKRRDLLLHLKKESKKN